MSAGPTTQERELAALAAGVRERRPRELGRALTRVEEGGATGRALVRELYDPAAAGCLVGITGPPGAGKSTLVSRLALALRRRGQTVAVLAVDPSSPFSGGAVLGDRIRMQELFTDPGAMIRSMATRGAVGGLAAAADDALTLLAAAGFDWVLVETVGVGQDEVAVAGCVDTVLVVTVPGLGDEIQAIKAGILEIADVFALNKADHPETQRAYRDLRLLLGMEKEAAWRRPVVKTVASRDEGTEELLDRIEAHAAWLRETGVLAERRAGRLRRRVEAILQRRVVESAALSMRLAAAEDGGGADPYSLAETIWRELTAAAPVGNPEGE